MHSHQDGRRERDEDAVQHVESKQGVGSDQRSSQEAESGIGARVYQRDTADLEQRGPRTLIAQDGRRPGHVRADRNRPHGQLVPWQEIACKRQEQRQNEENDADAPVELARGLIAAGQKIIVNVSDGERHLRDFFTRT